MAIFQMATDISAVIANIDECGLQRSILDVEHFCATNDCTGNQILNNLTNNVFKIIDKINTFVSGATSLPGETEEIIYDTMESMGTSIGATLRLILNVQFLWTWNLSDINSITNSPIIYFLSNMLTH